MCHCCLGYVYTRRRLGVLGIRTYLLRLLNSRGPGFQPQLRQLSKLDTIRESPGDSPVAAQCPLLRTFLTCKLEVRKKQAAHCSVASVALARRATVRGEALGSLSLHRELVLAATFCAGFCGVLGGRRAALGAP